MTFRLDRNGPTFNLPMSDVRAIHLRLLLAAQARPAPSLKSAEVFFRRALAGDESGPQPSTIAEPLREPLARAIDEVRRPLSEATQELRRHLADAPAPAPR